MLARLSRKANETVVSPEDHTAAVRSVLLCKNVTVNSPVLASDASVKTPPRMASSMSILPNIVLVHLPTGPILSSRQTPITVISSYLDVSNSYERVSVNFSRGRIIYIWVVACLNKVLSHLPTGFCQSINTTTLVNY
jgi:hypothetical protein